MKFSVAALTLSVVISSILLISDGILVALLFEIYMEDIEKDMQSNEEQRKQLNILFTRGYLERPVFAEAHNKLIMEYEQLVAKRDLHYRMDNTGYTMEQALSDMVSFLNGAEPFTEWDDSLFERFVEKVKVLSREEVEFELKFGLKLKERID